MEIFTSSLIPFKKARRKIEGNTIKTTKKATHSGYEKLGSEAF
jgi:hypothetical protein